MPYRSYAEFARTKGAKDKQQRKSRARELYDSAVSRASTGLRNAYVGAVDSAAGAYGRGKYAQVKEGTRRKANELYAKGKISAQEMRDRANSNKGAIAGGVAGAAALGLGARYGGAAINTALANKRLEKLGMANVIRSRSKNVIKNAATGGARGQAFSDLGNLIGKTGKGQLVRGGLIGAAGGTAAVMKYLKNRKKRQQMEG